MSKYTTEVRFICEHDAGLTESVGFNSVDSVLSSAWNKVFTTTVEFWNEGHRAVLCKKILKHYYLREIGAETVGIWKLWMNTKLEEIMPYYNQLYKSAELEFDPFNDVDLSRVYSGKTSDTRTEKSTTETTTTRTNNLKEDSSGTRTDNLKTASGNTRYDLYSDTPQGALDGVESETYLTNARKTTDTGDIENTGTVGTVGSVTNTGTVKDDGSGSTTGNSTGSGTDDHTETVKGKQGSASYSKLLEEYRRTLLNIDMMVIEEFDELFFGLW